MSKLSEEEIIKYIKDEIENETDTFYWFDNIPENKTRKQIEESINAHQGLLDLYNKEKGKNKELEKDISEMYYKGVVLDILQDELNISRDEAIEILDNY